MEAVAQLARQTPLAAYVTARWESNIPALRSWMGRNGFPDLPIIARPEAETANHSRWKASLLNAAYPMITGIVDDNTELPSQLGPGYRGKAYIFGGLRNPNPPSFAVSCPTWADVTNSVRAQVSQAALE